MSKRFARPYAQALLANLPGDDAARAARDDIARFVEVLDDVPGLRRMATSPAIPLDAKQAVVGLWSVGDVGLLEPAFAAEPGPATSMAFGATGELLATAHGDGRIRLWTPTGHQPLEPSLPAAPGLVGSVAVHPSGDHLYAGTAGGAIV